MIRNLDNSSQPSSGELVLNERERRRAELDRIALMHSGVVAIAAERVWRVAVRLDVGRERALEASRARRELHSRCQLSMQARGKDWQDVRRRPGTFRR